MLYKLTSNYFNKIFIKLKITSIQFEVLYLLYISEDKDIKMSLLGNELGMAKSGVTLLIDKMVSEKLVKRHYNLEDRRIVNIILTTKGAKVINEIIVNNNIFKTATLEFTQEEKAVLGKFVARVREVY